MKPSLNNAPNSLRLMVTFEGLKASLSSIQVIIFLSIWFHFWICWLKILRWVTRGSRTLVTQRCLVEFSIGNKYWDKIWCDVLPMDSCHVLLGRPWQWDRNIICRGQENVYELKMEGEPIKLFSNVEKMKREKTSFLTKEIVPPKKKKKCLYRVVAKKSKTWGRIFSKKGRMMQKHNNAYGK